MKNEKYSKEDFVGLVCSRDPEGRINKVYCVEDSKEHRVMQYNQELDGLEIVYLAKGDFNNIRGRLRDEGLLEFIQENRVWRRKF